MSVDIIIMAFYTILISKISSSYIFWWSTSKVTLNINCTEILKYKATNTFSNKWISSWRERDAGTHPVKRNL